MSVKQRGDCWQVSITCKGKRHRKDLPDERQALDWQAQMKADQLSGRLEAPAGFTNPDDKVFTLKPRVIRDRGLSMKAAPGMDGHAEFTPPVLRHIFATQVFGAGVDIRTVQELPGHKRVDTMQQNSHTTTERKRLAI